MQIGPDPVQLVVFPVSVQILVVEPFTGLYPGEHEMLHREPTSSPPVQDQLPLVGGVKDVGQ